MAGSSQAQNAVRLQPWLSQRSDLFKGLSTEAGEALLAHGVVRRFSREALIVQQDSEAKSFFMVVEGSITARLSHEGIQRDLFSYESGQIAGCLALLRPGRWPYAFVATSDAELVEFDAFLVSQHVAALRPLALEVLRGVSVDLARHSREIDLQILRFGVQQQASTVGTGQTFRRDDR